MSWGQCEPSGRVFLNNTPELQTEIFEDCILRQTFETGSDKVGASYSMRYLDTSSSWKETNIMIMVN